jgi:hypothetical protein
MEKHPWEDLDTDLPEPGTVEDKDLGLPGDAEELPDGDADRDDPDIEED